MVFAPDHCSALIVTTSPFRRQVPCPTLFESKEPSLLYVLVLPLFQQIFLPLRSASVTPPATAGTDCASAAPHTTTATINDFLDMIFSSITLHKAPFFGLNTG